MTLLKSSQWLPGRKIKYSDLHWVGEAVPLILVQSWPWGSQIDEKNPTCSVNLLYLCSEKQILSENSIEELENGK